MLKGILIALLVAVVGVQLYMWSTLSDEEPIVENEAKAVEHVEKKEKKIERKPFVTQKEVAPSSHVEKKEPKPEPTKTAKVEKKVQNPSKKKIDETYDGEFDPIPGRYESQDDPAEIEAMKDKVGEGLTLEQIEKMNISEEEKERLKDDLAYYQSRHDFKGESVSSEEVERIVEEDMKKEQN
jgi:hypothetical protein